VIRGGREWVIVACGGMWWEEARWVTWQREACINKQCCQKYCDLGHMKGIFCVGI
jgi:hypothetical protein